MNSGTDCETCSASGTFISVAAARVRFSMASEVVSAELARLDGRAPDLTETERLEVHRTVRRVVDKLLHQPTVRVQELSANPESLDYAAALRELFALDPQTIAAVMSPEVTTTK